MSNTPVVKKINHRLLQKLDPEGRIRLTACLQCGRCSSGCTVRAETDLLPHQLNRLAALGMEKRLLESRMIWTCVSCNACVTRCPMHVDTPALVDKLRSMAERAPTRDLERVRIFNETLLDSVRRFGRTYEFLLMAVYKLRTRDLFSDLGKLPMMLRKGKIALWPSVSGGRRAVAAIFDRVRSARRAQS